MQEARHYQKSDDGNAVRCLLCAHRCRIKEGGRGLCRVRENRSGVLYSLVYGKLVSEQVDPIEKKPIFHLLPGSRSYSIATVGCNFQCRHCQNFEISQYPDHHADLIPGRQCSPEATVVAAIQGACTSISYTYVEPTIFYEFALDTARIACEKGLRNIFVSNGYLGAAATREIAPFLTADNIDLKSFSDHFYQKICGARLRPVLDNIRLMKELGVWVEVTTLIIPSLNDSVQELRAIAEFIRSIDPEMPWHVTAFHPTFRMTSLPPTPATTLKMAREIGLAAGLRYVYSGNLPGGGGEDTVCPRCRSILIERIGFRARITGMTGNTCRSCGTVIAGIFAD